MLPFYFIGQVNVKFGPATRHFLEWLAPGLNSYDLCSAVTIIDMGADFGLRIITDGSQLICTFLNQRLY